MTLLLFAAPLDETADEDAILANIDHQDPTISLILVPRGLEGTGLASLLSCRPHAQQFKDPSMPSMRSPRRKR